MALGNNIAAGGEGERYQGKRGFAKSVRMIAKSSNSPLENGQVGGRRPSFMARPLNSLPA
jgi:hypothetical protein